MIYNVAENQNCVTKYYSKMKEMGAELERSISGSDFASIQLLYLEEKVYGFNISSKFFELVGYSRENYLLLEEDKYGNKLINRTDLQKLLEWADSVEEGTESITENLRFMNKERGYIWFETKISCRNIDDKAKALSILVGKAQKEIFGARSSVEEIIDMAQRDPLTGLFNKIKIKSLINEYLECGPNMKGAFLMVDIDNFKEINDNLGHKFGDDALLFFANGIKARYENAYIGRVGGDEIVLFFPNLVDEEKINVITDELIHIFDNMWVNGEKKNITTCSIGVAYAPKDGIEYMDLYTKADTALYAAKSSGKSEARVYDEASEKLRVEKEKKFLEVKNINDDEGKLNVKGQILSMIFDMVVEEDSENNESLFYVVLRKIGKEYGLDSVSIKDFSIKQREFEVVQQWKTPNFPYSMGYTHSVDSLEHECFVNTQKYERAIILSKHGVFGSKTSSVESREYFFENQIGTGIYAPILEKGLLLGVIAFESLDKDREWTDREKNDLFDIGKALSLYLVKVKAFKYAKQTIDYANTIDDLSGLIKYDNFLENAKALCSVSADKYNYFVSYIDINDFKVINDKFGNKEGDKLIKLVANIISRDSAVSIFSARVFSDCFVTLWRIKKHQSVKIIKERINDWKNSVADIYEDMNLTISVGISEVNDNVHEAVENANFARKYRKEKYNNNVTVFDKEMKKEYRKEHKVLDNFALGIKRGEFFIQVQPKVLVPEMKIVGGEALVRWKTKKGEIVGPGEFVPYLEKTGNIKELDFFVYEEVFKYLDERIKNGEFVVPISVNVSGRHMKDKDFYGDIKRLSAKYNVPTKYIEFEVTESVFYDDHERAKNILNSLKEDGYKISMDDFGVGYSSLSILNNLNFDVLKLDRSFINKELKENDKIMLECIIDMARKLGIEVLCEGVETKEQLDVLQGMGCKLIQGFYFSKPLNFDKFEEAVEKCVI